MKKITFPVVLFLLAACSSNNESRQTEETVATVVTVDETVPDTVQVDAVTSATSKPNQVSFNGTMVIPPQRMATVSLTMGGVVKSTSLLPGESVGKGTVLATLENPEFITLQQTYLDSHAQAEYLEAEYRRQKALSAEQAASQKKFQQSKADYLSMKSRMEAELKSLRNQLNPHFLLNTLNNIYALIAFDTDKAQQAVQELSRLLRYVLYDNQEKYVPLCKEVGFICNYIELMRIRLPRHVRLDVSLPENPSHTLVAPLLFISLVENAFKHGVSNDRPSFIDIDIREEEGVLACRIENSFFPKSEADRSGSGIGLANLCRRLEMIYPGRYEMKYGQHGDTYETLLRINLTDR